MGVYIKIQQHRLAIGMVLSLGACAEPVKVWVAPPNSAQTEEQLRAGCQLQAERAFYSSDESSEARATRIAHQTDLCMKAEGWRHIPKPEEPAGP